MKLVDTERILARLVSDARFLDVAFGGCFGPLLFPLTARLLKKLLDDEVEIAPRIKERRHIGLRLNFGRSKGLSDIRLSAADEDSVDYVLVCKIVTYVVVPRHGASSERSFLDLRLHIRADQDRLSLRGPVAVIFNKRHLLAGIDKAMLEVHIHLSIIINAKTLFL